MNTKNTIKFSTIIISSLLPLYAYGASDINTGSAGDTTQMSTEVVNTDKASTEIANTAENTSSKNSLENAVDKVGEIFEKTGEGIENIVKSIGDATTETTTTGKIKSLLSAESDVPANISVTTNNDVVELSGVVDTKLQADRIVEIASSVDGVKSVDSSRLTIAKSDNFFTDAIITAKAKASIMQLSFGNKIGSGSDLRVETTNGVVHIFGSVSGSTDIDVIKKDVREIDGVREVKVNIKVVTNKS